MTNHEIHLIILDGTVTLMDGKENSVNDGWIQVSGENPPTEEEIHAGIVAWMKTANGYVYSGNYQIVKSEKSNVGDPEPIECTNPMDPVWALPEPEPEPEP